MKRGFRNGLIVVAITLGMLMACELLSRALLWHGLETASATPSEVEFGYSTTGYGDILPNLDTIVRLYPPRPFYLHTNSSGLRNLDEIDPDPNTLRVLAIGDSFTYGMYVHNHETFPARLEEHLNQRSERRIQVFNAGIPGYTIEDELGYLRDKGLALEPDVVILGVYTNDIFDMYPSIRQHFARPVVLGHALAQMQPEVRTTASWLGENSALYNLVGQVAGVYKQAQVEAEVNRITPQIPGLDGIYQDLTFLNPDKPEYQDEWNGYEENLRAMIDLLASENIPLVIVLFPDLSQMPEQGGMPTVPQDFFARVTAQTGTPYLDMLPVFRRAGDIQSLYLMYYNPNAQVNPDAPDAAVQIYTGDGHPSPYGHLVTARALADLLFDQGLIPSQ
jgi:lysophospholipase L1-like esterase